MTTIDTTESKTQCEYCGCIMEFPFNRIKRLHKQDNIPICSQCIQSLYLRGDIVLNENSRWQLTEDIRTLRCQYRDLTTNDRREEDSIL
jgi:NAD-dependent SIR2 family protein deacetylase